ncbi:MAG: hypothetical protein JWM80_4572 [Cyanobacteria bacterium RYN_339]|nr:hypothetical protein [Cyanobacteria bacterium RYN_339]
MFNRHTAKLFTVATIASVLVGCGKAPVTGAILGQANAGQIVGIPANYQAGQPLAGTEGQPTLRKVNWPTITRTADGTPSDPVNLIIAGTEAQVRHVFGAEGWVEADKLTAWTAIKTIKGALADSAYPTSPMSDLYMYNRKQDIALQKNATSVRHRDHLRVWQTPLKDHYGRPFWAVAATHDIAIKWSAGEVLPTHEIAPSIDLERQLVVDDFAKSGQIKLRYQLQALPTNFHSVNGGGDEIFSDGKCEVLELVVLKIK